MSMKYLCFIKGFTQVRKNQQCIIEVDVIVRLYIIFSSLSKQETYNNNYYFKTVQVNIFQLFSFGVLKSVHT